MAQPLPTVNTSVVWAAVALAGLSLAAAVLLDIFDTTTTGEHLTVILAFAAPLIVTLVTLGQVQRNGNVAAANRAQLDVHSNMLATVHNQVLDADLVAHRHRNEQAHAQTLAALDAHHAATLAAIAQIKAALPPPAGGQQ